MTNKDNRRVTIRTADTDVPVLAISLFNDFGVIQLWIDFGSGKHRIFWSIHEMCVDEIKHTGLLFYWLWPGFIPC